jgi:hypothetical protein
MVSHQERVEGKMRESRAWESLLHNPVDQPTNNRTPFTYGIVACTAVAMQRPWDGRMCTRAVSGQWLGKHIPAKQTMEQRPLLGSRFLIMQQLDYNNGRAVFSTWSVPKGYKRDMVRA